MADCLSQYIRYYLIAPCSVSDYGAEIWGFESGDAITKNNLTAARCFLGLPKHATPAGVLSEINWPELVYIAEVRMLRQYFRIIETNDSRLIKKLIHGIKLFLNKIIYSLCPVKKGTFH